MNKTSIEWTHRPETGGAAGGFTWNPIRARRKVRVPNDGSTSASANYRLEVRSGTACTKISPGCANCYASTINKRFGTGLEFTVPNLEKIEFFIDERILEEPLKRKKPATIFVGDMFDLFHEAIPQELIAEVLRIAWKLPRHTFQILTKRAERMQRMVTGMYEKWGEPGEQPHENIWLGVSVESQKYADERIPLLLQTPAAVRFLSVEPMLEAVDVSRYMWPAHWHWDAKYATPQEALAAGAYAERKPQALMASGIPMVDWVICGGESGPGARPFNVAWAELLMEQCKAAGVAFFMKQLGSDPWWMSEEEPRVSNRYRTRDRKGGDPSEWPEHLRVRQFPTKEVAA